MAPLLSIGIKIYNGTGETIYVNGAPIEDKHCQCYQTIPTTIFPITAQHSDALRIIIPAQLTNDLATEEILDLAVGTDAMLSFAATKSLFLNLLPNPHSVNRDPEPRCGE